MPTDQATPAAGADRAPTPPPARPAVRARLRAIAPWLVGAAVLAWLFHRVPFAALRDALARAPLLPFLAVAVAYPVVTLCLDSYATFAVLRHSLPGTPMRFRDILRIRGASILLALVNYGVGQGGIAYFLNRRYGTPIGRAAGAVLLNAGVTVLLTALCAGLGVAVGGAPGSRALTVTVVGLAAGFPVYLAVIALRPRRLARVPLLAPLFDAGLRGHLAGLAARLPHMADLILFSWASMLVFGLHPPFARALALLPLVFIVAVLPVSPGGLGTVQAATVTLFAAWAPGETAAAREAAVLAYSVSFQSLCMLTQVVLGLGFLRAESRAATLESGGEPWPSDTSTGSHGRSTG